MKKWRILGRFYAYKYCSVPLFVLVGILSQWQTIRRVPSSTRSLFVTVITVIIIVEGFNVA